MGKVRIYLDNCAYNRPFDSTDQLTVHMEASAKLRIQEDVRGGVYELVWSYMNEYENDNNPFDEKREAIAVWEHIASHTCPPTETILEKGEQIRQLAIRTKDALNLACAIETACQYFITTDKPLLRKADMLNGIKVINPIDFIREMEEADGNDG